MEPVRKRLLKEHKAVDAECETIDGLIAKIIENKADSVTLTGGEPTLRKDFFDLLERLSDSDLAITVQTNGRNLSKAAALDRLAAMSRRDITFVVALHGASAAIHDQVTRKARSFQETTLAIQNLRSIGFPVCGKIVLSSYNLHGTAETLNYMRTLGIDDAMVAYPHAEDFSSGALKEILPSYGSVQAMLQTVPGPKAGMRRMLWETIPFCIFPTPDFFPFSLDVEYFREKLQTGQTFIEMSMTGETLSWHDTRKTIKSKASQCQACLVEQLCEGVWSEYFDVHASHGFTPIQNMELINTFLEQLS
jgi:sulfatase maturation enzyme AslB (radical SAM superfamily)